MKIWVRDAMGIWSRREARSGETAQLEPIAATLDVDAVYRAAQEPTE